MRNTLSPSIIGLLASCAAMGCGSGAGENPGSGGAATSSTSTSSHAGGNAGGSGGAAIGGSGTGGSVGGGGSGGSTTTSTSTGSGGTGGTGGGPMPTHLPTATGACPEMKNLDGGQVTFKGQPTTVWSGNATGGGPLLIYYYATGGTAMEPLLTIGAPQIATITSMGGAVVAQNATTGQGGTTGNNVWFKGDAAIADEIVACAIQKQKIDPRRIHVAGYSAGAFQTVYMGWARSGYVASLLSYSGGDDFLDQAPLQDPAHPPVALVAHGAHGQDVLAIFDFADASVAWEAQIAAAHGFAIDCDDGSNHIDVFTRTKIAPQALQFFLDHPFGVTPEPYTTLPPGWPSYCMIK
jgi:predicted esterase